jgi:uncharacterized protein YgbK (DUF1537 family)
MFDVIDDETLAEAGRLIWDARGAGLFAAASSGLEYALVAHWRAAGLLPSAPVVPECGPVERLLVVSGSCSPGTAQQIRWAAEHGFVPIRLDVLAVIDPARARQAIERAIAESCATLAAARDAIVFSAEGPQDPAIGTLREAAQAIGIPAARRAACSRATRSAGAKGVSTGRLTISRAPGQCSAAQRSPASRPASGPG